MEQEQRMQELLEIEKNKEKQKEIEKQKKILKKMESMQIREKIKQLRQQFKGYNMSASPENIELHIRLPSGKRIIQFFNRNQRVLFVKHYIWQLEENGICDDFDEEDEEELEEGDNPYAIDILWGYPPRKLDENQTLAQCFGGSSGESLNVKLV